MSFLNDYQIYTAPLEVPEIFHIWCSMSALAAVAQRKVWLDMGHFKVAPNLYVILDSIPGKCGKDTAMDIVRDLLSEIKSVHTKSDAITKEKIFQDMAAGTQVFNLTTGEHIVHSSLTIFATEMSLLIKRGDKDFVGALNALFNTKAQIKNSTKNRGEDIIINPFLNILAGTTPEWINNNIQEDVIEGGLSARSILLFSDTPKAPNPFPDITPEGYKARERLLYRLEEISLLGGQLQFTTKGKEFYSNWYIRYHQTQPENPKMVGFHYRKRAHLLKTTILMSLADRSDLLIKEEDLERALQLLDITEPAIEEALRGVGRNILSGIAQDILLLVKRAKELSQDELVRATFAKVDSRELGEILRALQQMGQIRIDQKIEMGKATQPIIVYTGGERK